MVLNSKGPQLLAPYYVTIIPDLLHYQVYVLFPDTT